MYTKSSVDTLRLVYAWSEVDIVSLDDNKYLLRKKLSEVKNGSFTANFSCALKIELSRLHLIHSN